MAEPLSSARHSSPAYCPCFVGRRAGLGFFESRVEQQVAGLVDGGGGGDRLGALAAGAQSDLNGLHEGLAPHGLVPVVHPRASEANFNDAIDRVDAVEHEVHGLVRPAGGGGHVQPFHHLASVEQDVEAVFARVQTACGGKGSGLWSTSKSAWMDKLAIKHHYVMIDGLCRIE